MKRRLISLLLISLLFSSEAFAAWPSLSARSKDWGSEVLTDTDLEAQLDLLHTYFNDSLNSSSGHKHQGTTNDGPKIPINTSLTIASQAQGDIIYASSASAWARLGAGTSGQVLKTNGTGANPSWATVNVSPHYRKDFACSYASSTTITVNPGSVDINGTIASVATATTLTLSTANNWATTQKQQTSTYSYIGVDSSNHVMLGATAPTHSDYGLTSTDGVKRYVSWTGGTNAGTYRVIGWFYMNSTGSGELDSYAVSNVGADSAVNEVHRTADADDTINDTSYGTDLTEGVVRFYATGTRPVMIIYKAVSTNNMDNSFTVQVDIDGSNEAYSTTSANHIAGNGGTLTMTFIKTGLSQGTHTITMEGIVSGSSDVIDGAKVLDVMEL